MKTVVRPALVDPIGQCELNYLSKRMRIKSVLLIVFFTLMASVLTYKFLTLSEFFFPLLVSLMVTISFSVKVIQNWSFYSPIPKSLCESAARVIKEYPENGFYLAAVIDSGREFTMYDYELVEDHNRDVFYFELEEREQKRIEDKYKEFYGKNLQENY